MKGRKKEYFELDLNLNTDSITLIILVLATLAINLYYFSANTGVWWDEAEYLSFVNHLVKGSPYSLWEGRAIMYPLLLSLFGFINSSETFLRIVLILISCATVFLTYKVSNKLFKHKVALITSALLLTSFLFNFLSLRFLTGIPSLLFILLSLNYYLNNNYKHRLLAGLFLGVAVAMRFTSVFLIPALIIYDLLNKSSLKSYVWLPAILLGFIPTSIFDILGGNAPWTTLYAFFTQSTMSRDWGHNLGDWTYYFTNSPTIIGFFGVIFFLLGLFFVVAKLKSKNNNKLVLILVYILTHLAFYSFMTPLKEERYIMPILPFILIIASFGLIIASNSTAGFINKFFKYKHNSLILLIIFTASIAIPSLQYGGVLIPRIGTSYAALRFAGEQVKELSTSEEVIVTNSGPHTAYHTERQVAGFPNSMNSLYSLLDNDARINFLLFSFYETLPSYIEEFVNNSRFSVAAQYEMEGAPIVIVLRYLRQ